MGRRVKKKPKINKSRVTPPPRPVADEVAAAQSAALQSPSPFASGPPPVTRHQTIADATEVLDGKAYEDCTFARCHIVYKGGELPILNGCNFDDCSWDLDEAAHRTLDYLRGIYHGMGRDGRALVEQTFEMIREEPHGQLVN